MATRPKPNWKRITLAVAIVLPIAAIADLGIFQIKAYGPDITEIGPLAH